MRAGVNVLVVKHGCSVLTPARCADDAANADLLRLQAAAQAGAQAAAAAGRRTVAAREAADRVAVRRCGV